MAVDGSIWLLADKFIEEYYLGQLSQTILPDLFPEVKNLTKIFTSPSHSYLYVLEPANKRLIVFDKSGKIISQYQSEKFNNLLDFSVSQDKKTIYLLNNLKIYQINTENY